MVRSNDIAVENSDFSKFATGIELGNSENVSIVGATFTDISVDGIRFGGIDGLRIENSAFSNFRAAVRGENHKDAIQGTSSAAEAASSDVVIRGNDFDLAEVVHAIYLGNELVLHNKIKSSYYENVLIENNDIDSAHVWGIAVLHADGLTIRGNSLVQNPDKGFTDPVNVPLINVSQDSLNVRIQGNEVAVVPLAQNSSWVVSDNSTGTKKHVPTYWEHLFPGGGPVGAGIDTGGWDAGAGDRRRPGGAGAAVLRRRRQRRQGDRRRRLGRQDPRRRATASTGTRPS